MIQLHIKNSLKLCIIKIQFLATNHQIPKANWIKCDRKYLIFCHANSIFQNLLSFTVFFNKNKLFVGISTKCHCNVNKISTAFEGLCNTCNTRLWTLIKYGAHITLETINVYMGLFIPTINIIEFRLNLEFSLNLTSC